MTNPHVAPWGSPPTPVLPRWLIEQQSFTPLPWALRQSSSVDGSFEVVGDLARFWEHRSRSLTSDEHDALVALASPSKAHNHSGPPEDLVVIPGGVDLLRLLGLPLRRRTRNCIRRAISAKKLDEGQPVTVGQLLSLHSFGIRSLLDLMCIVEAALNTESLLRPPTDSSPAATTTSDPATVLPNSPDPSSAAWDPATVVLKRLLAAASEIDGARTLADALKGDLGGLAFDLGMEEHLGSIAIADLTGEPAVAEEALSALNELWESLSLVERSILQDRLLTATPLTLKKLGQTANLTRERIRQIEKSVERHLTHPSITGPAVICWFGVLALQILEECGPITSQLDLDKRIAATFSFQETPEDDNGDIPEMARHLLRQELGYSCTDGLCIGAGARSAIADLKDQAASLADEIGLLDETELRACLPDESWDEHWEILLDQTGLHRLCGRLALRDTSKAKAKAALLAIGRPATKEEVGELSGLRPDRAGAQLSLLDGVVRADKTRWGLSEWIDDEYEGIPAEIIQRINEDGGTTRLNRLLEELPRMFGVSKASVRAYLDTPAFRAEHGWVSTADDHGLLLGRLEDVIDGYDDGGDPYWEFEIEDRHLDGYSLHGIPFELAVALNCEFGGKSAARVRRPEGSQDISVIWRKTSMHGPEIGRLGPSLAAIGARGGDEVRLLIHNQHEVSFKREQRDSAGRRVHQLERSSGTARERQNTPFGGVKMGEPISGRLSTEVRMPPAASDGVM